MTNTAVLRTRLVTESPPFHDFLHYCKHKKMLTNVCCIPIKLVLCNVPRDRIAFKINKSFYHKCSCFHTTSKVFATITDINDTPIKTEQYEDKNNIYIYLNIPKGKNVNNICEDELNLCIKRMIICVKKCVKKCDTNEISSNVGYFTEVPHKLISV